MFVSSRLKPLRPSDFNAVREVYADAIQSQDNGLYTKEQIQSWAALAWLPGVLDRPLVEGKGWISFHNTCIAAFAVRFPIDRLALLYCRGCFVRKGHASALLDQVEQEAVAEGQNRLVTEASLFSYPLLLKRDWKLIETEQIQIGGVTFDRYLMAKNLCY